MAPPSPSYGPYVNWRDRPIPPQDLKTGLYTKLEVSKEYWAEVRARGDKQHAEKKVVYKQMRRYAEGKSKKKCKKWLPIFLAEDNKAGWAKKKRFGYLFRKVRKWCHPSWGRTGRSKAHPIIIK